MADFRRRRVILFLMMLLDGEHPLTLHCFFQIANGCASKSVPSFLHSLLCVRSPTLSPHCQQRLQCFRDYIFLPILLVVFIPQKWVFTVELDKDSGRGNAPSCFDHFTLTFRFFSAILKQGAMEGEF